VKYREIYWLSGILVISILLTGFFCRFNYTREVEVQLHDTYIIVLPLHFVLVLWSILAFIIYLIRGIRGRFSSTVSTWIFLVTNTFMTLLTGFITYMAFAFLALDGLLDLFRETKQADRIEYFSATVTSGIVITVMLLTAEIFLIVKLIHLRRGKQMG
jgi:hypothetical protein